MTQRKKQLLTLADVRHLLLTKIDEAGTQTEWARRARVNRSIVCAFLAGKKPLQPKLVKALRLKRVVAYASW